MPQTQKPELDALAAEIAPMLIADQNDQFRKAFHDPAAQLDAALHGQIIQGKTLLTHGLNARGFEFMDQAMQAVAAFDTFTEDNDPQGEHNFGSFEIEGETLFWKIDLYDADYLYGSENPSDLGTTRRVLTIMLASEY